MRKLVYPFFFFLYFVVLIFIPLEFFTQNVYLAFILFSAFGIFFPFWSAFFCTRGANPYTDARYTCPWSQLLIGLLIFFYKRYIFPSSPYDPEYIDTTKIFIISFFALAGYLFFVYCLSDRTNIRLCNVCLVLLVFIFGVMVPSVTNDIDASPPPPSSSFSSFSSLSFCVISSQSNSSVSKEVNANKHTPISSSTSNSSFSIYKSPPTSPWGEEKTTNEITGPLSQTSYWTPNGKSYHFSKGCPSLSRSKTIFSGTLSDALDAGKTDPCNNCAGG